MGNPLLRHDNELIRAATDRSFGIRDPKDLKPLLDRIADSKIVMLGEATHGTHEFYEWRRLISEWLIVKHGFRLIAVEADWPPAWQLNRYVRTGSGDNARNVLSHFNRWPTWMWANTEIIRLTEWLRSHNSTVSEKQRVGFFGLDVYSLFESINVVLKQLEKVNPFLARRARIRYSCFDRFEGDERKYTRSLIEIPEGCKREVMDNLQELLNARLDDLEDPEEALFDARQNARIVANAENYYRTMIHGDEDSWNVRDRHMMETLNLLLERHGSDAKAIVWAHNTHIGDYRATDMLADGLINIGGLARTEWGEEKVSLVGFGTDHGSVIASPAWDGPIEKLSVPPGKAGTYEAILHSVAERKGKIFCLPMNDAESRQGPLAEVRGHRAIGVVYRPSQERLGNYVPTSLANRYDAFIFIDETQALDPFVQDFEREDIPETWPRGY